MLDDETEPDKIYHPHQPLKNTYVKGMEKEELLSPRIFRRQNIKKRKNNWGNFGLC